MADNAGDSGGEWTLIMTDAARKRGGKSLHDTDSRRKNNLTLTGASSVTRNTMVLNSNPSSRGWETLPKKSSVPANPGTSKMRVPFPTCRMITKNNDPSPRGREWETLVTKHRELNA